MIEIALALAAIIMLAGLVVKRAVSRRPFFFAYACGLLLRSALSSIPVPLLSQGISATGLSWLEAILLLGLFAEISRLGLSRRLWVMGMGVVALFAAIAGWVAIIEGDGADLPSTRLLLPVQTVLTILVGAAGVRVGFGRSRFARILFIALVCNTLGRIGAVLQTVAVAPLALGFMLVSMLGFLAAAWVADAKEEIPPAEIN